MNLSEITTRGWILALFIRDDGERFLLGDGWYDFKDGLQHFQPNTIANDIVELQGTDGQLLAGQVRRSTAQRFNGYIGDSTIPKAEIEARRMAFLQFFQVRRNYDVIYIFPDGTSIKRERGYLVEAPSVPEMWQFYPEYSVALNFENVNYYEYAEDDAGQEIFAHSALVAISNSLKGGLIWDNDGAYSEALNWSNFQTKSGSKIQIADAIAGSPMSLTQLDGNATQNGTPTPDAPIAIETVTGGQTVSVVGKNLASFTSMTEIAISQVTAVKTDNKLELTLTAKNSYANMQFATGIKVKNGDTVTISAHAKSTESGVIPSYRIGKGGAVSFFSGYATATASGDGYNLEKTITADGDYELYILFYPVSNIASGDIQTFNTGTFTDFQAEYGSTPTAYTPYQGQSYEVNLGGTNLVNQSELIAGYVQSNGYPTVSQTQAEMRTDYLEVEPNTTYTFSIQATTDTYSPWFGWCEYTGQTPTTVIGTRQVINSNPATFTTSATAKYVILSARNLQHATKVQLEKRSTATPYVPYTTYQIELAKIGTYQDYIWNDNGVWKIHKEVGKVVLDGTEDGWMLTSGANRYSFWRHNNMFPNAKTSPDVKMCDNFTYSSAYYTNAPIPSLCENSIPTTPLFIFTTDGSQGTTVADWKTWLSTHPTTVYYALKTPTDTEITDDTLLAQLNTISELYGGVNNISLVPSAGAQGTMKIQYATELLPGGGYVWQEGDTGGVTTVNVIGVANAQPIWTVTGPAVDPTLTNITTGQAITWSGTVPNGQTLVVDMGKQTAELNGANVYSGISGDWIDLEIGQNKLTYSATGGEIPPSKIEWNGVVG